MDYRQLRTGIKKGKTAPVYIFSGPEEYLKEELLREIIQCQQQRGNSLDLERTDGSRLSLLELMDKVKQKTIFAGVLYWVTNPPYLTASKKQAASKRQEGAAVGEKELINFAQGESPGSMIIFSVEKADKRKKLVKAFDKAGMLVEFLPLKGNALLKWLRDELFLLDKQAEEAALFELVERVGEDLRLLKREIEKLAVYMGQDKLVTCAMVRELVPESREGNIFNLVGAVVNKDIDTAFANLLKMRQQNEHPLVILSMIIRQFRLLCRVQPLLERNMPLREIASLLKIPPFAASELIMQAEKYNEEMLAGIIAYLKELDVNIKSGHRKGNEALEQLILQLLHK